MFETITLLIDNEELLLNEFLELARETTDAHDLADVIESWFTEWFDEDTVHVQLDTDIRIRLDKKYQGSVQFMFQHILSHAIQTIDHKTWLDVANHYITKANESN